jgi:hypothetical protein
MSIYAQLLNDALSQSHSDEVPTAAETLTQLLKARNRLGANLSSYPKSEWAPAAVADQVAYDIALIELARLLGIEVSLARFSRPEHERTQLERAVVSRGIPLDEIEVPTGAREKTQLKWGHR